MRWFRLLTGKRHTEKEKIVEYCLVKGHPIYENEKFETLGGEKICSSHSENKLGTLGTVPSKK